MLEDNNFDHLNDEFATERLGQSSSSRKRGSKSDPENRQKKKETIKIRLFKIYYQLTKERNTDKFIASFLILAMFIQIYDLIISPIMRLPFRGALYDAVANVFDIIRIYPAVIRSENVEAYWFFMNKFLISTIMYIVLLVLVDFFLRNHKYYMTWPIKQLQTFSIMIFWLFVIPATDFFISIFECDENGLHFVDKSLVCWSAKHSFYCALYSFGIILFTIISFIVSLLFTESRPYHTDALTRLDTNFEVYLTIYRIILTVVSHYTSTQNYHWLVLALHFLMSAHFIKDYLKYLPFYYVQISTLYGACCLGYLWVTINAIIVKALDSIEYRGQIIVILIGFLFLYPCAYYLRHNRFYKILMLKSQEKIKNDLELDQFATNFQNILLEQQQSRLIEVQFLGFLFLHREECQSLTCPLKFSDHLYLPMSDSTSKRDLFPSHDKIVHQHLLNSIFLEYQKLHPNTLTSLMHSSYATFLFFQMGNTHMALVELNLAAKCSTTLQQAFSIYKAKNVIEEHLVKRFKSGTKTGNQIIGANMSLQAYSELDVTIVITFEGLFNRLEKQIEQSATDHIEFWSHLDSSMIDLNVINKLGLNIINQTKKVNEIWNQLIKINPNYPNALYIYGNYLSQIKNDLEQGEEYKNHYHQVKRLKSMDDYENQFDLMFAEDTTVIIMNGNREQQGKIIKTNQGIFKLFGYSMFEVQGHDINILMPPVIAFKHQGFLEKYFKTGKERIINNCLESFAMYRTGIIFPIHLVVKTVPSLRNDIQYIGMIKRSSRDYEYILTDENGRIDSISEGITSLLKLPISFFKDHDIPIQVLVPELCEVSRQKANGNEPITNFEQWNGVKDLRFMVPKNFSSSTSRGGATTGGTSMKMGDGTSEDVNSGTGTGTGTGTQTSSSSKNMKHLSGLLTPNQQQAFVGLKSSDSLKIISNMFKNAEHKAQPEKYKTNLLNHVNYTNADFDKMLKTDLQIREYSDGDLKVKVFKIFYSKKKKNQIGKRPSENSSQNNGGNGKDEETMLHKFGFTGMSALNDKYVFQKYKELLANAKGMDKNLNNQRLQHDIEVLKVLLDRQKKVRTNGNIMTPTEYENAELDRMKLNIELLEQQISDMNTETSKNSKHQNAHNQSTVNMINQGTENSSLGIRGGTNQSFQQPTTLKNSHGNTEDDNSTNQPKGPFSNMFAGQNGNNQTDQQKSFQPSQFSQSPGFKNLQSNQPGTNQDDKSGYDEEFDEEDSKTDQATTQKTKKKKSKGKLGGDGASSLGNELVSGTKIRKPKEDPRRDFVNDFFKQNLNQGTLNPM